MQTLIPNRWQPANGGIEIARILDHQAAKEGLDFARVRFTARAEHVLPTDAGALFSVLRGTLTLSVRGEELHLGAGTHGYLPPESRAVFRGEEGAELLHACSPSADRARGTELLLRSDRFLAGSAVGGQSMRWILTPQYLSRRAFLHHDETLLSPRGEPLSWFHTTMFDAEGLPKNAEGRPVFKMSYNYRTEPNVCYEVVGRAQVRMARHPYRDDSSQTWAPWQSLSGDCTYYLREDVDEAEMHERDGRRRPRRNKHEVAIEDGHVSLICMHHPACTGAERHSEGAYSEYGDLADVLGTEAYREHLGRMRPLDAMVDALSLADARGESVQAQPQWEAFCQGRQNQMDVEAKLLAALRNEGQGREEILASWVLAGH